MNYFQMPPKLFTFIFINSYYLWFAYSQMYRINQLINDINNVNIADSAGIPIFSGAVSLLLFALPYYLGINILFNYVYKISIYNKIIKIILILVCIVTITALVGSLINLNLIDKVAVVDLCLYIVWLYIWANSIKKISSLKHS